VDIIKNLRQINLQGWSRRLSLFTAILAGATAASVFAVHPWTWLQPRVVDSAALAGVGGLLFFGLRRGLSPSRLFYLLVALGVLAGYAGLG
jgi:hypothetical protein